MTRVLVHKEKRQVVVTWLAADILSDHKAHTRIDWNAFVTLACTVCQNDWSRSWVRH